MRSFKIMLALMFILISSGFYRQIPGTNDPVRWEPHSVVVFGFCDALRSFPKDELMFAFNKWQEALGDALTLQYGGFGGWADRQIWICLDKKWIKGVHYNASGLTQTEFSTWTGALRHAKIFLNNSSYKWLKTDKSSKVLINLKEVMLHEVGHALGLLHSKNPKSVMHDNLSRFVLGLEYTLSSEDVERIQKLYSLKATGGCSCQSW